MSGTLTLRGFGSSDHRHVGGLGGSRHKPDVISIGSSRNYPGKSVSASTGVPDAHHGDGSLQARSCPHFTERENNCFPFPSPDPPPPSPCRHRDAGMQAGINQSSSQADEVYFTLKKWPTLRGSRGSLIFGRQSLWPPELAQVGPELAGPRLPAPKGLIARSGCQIAPSRRRH